MWRSAVQVCQGLRMYGGLAQLARAPALHAGGQRFESVILHQAATRGIWNWKFFTSHISLFTCVSATVFDMLEQKEKLVQIHERRSLTYGKVAWRD